jgi:hypothetical protein
MARQNGNPADLTMPRSWTARIFALFTLIFPVVFYLLSMSFALKTIYDPAYAESIVYDDTPEIANYTNTTNPYTQKASPFFSWWVAPNLPLLD